MRELLTITLWELRARRWSVLWWIVGLIAFVSLVVLVYPTFRDDGAMLDKSLNQIPAAAMDLFTDTSSLFSPIGYLSSQLYYLMLPLLFIFLAVQLGASLIAREEHRHTLELLLARPVSRVSVVLGKALAGFVVLVVVGGIVGLASAAEVALVGFDGVSAANILMATAVALVVGSIFGAVALALSAAGRLGRGLSIGVAALLALMSYLFSSLDKTVDWLVWPAKLLPFHYYHAADLLGGQVAWWSLGGMIAVVALLVVVAVLAFRRRDIA